MIVFRQLLSKRLFSDDCSSSNSLSLFHSDEYGFVLVFRFYDALFKLCEPAAHAHLAVFTEQDAALCVFRGVAGMDADSGKEGYIDEQGQPLFETDGLCDYYGMAVRPFIFLSGQP